MGIERMEELSDSVEYDIINKDLCEIIQTADKKMKAAKKYMDDIPYDKKSSMEYINAKKIYDDVRLERKNAIEKLYCTNRGMLTKMANYHLHQMNSKLDFEDLIQTGILGLIEAAERCDLSYDSTFITYATFYIMQKMQRANDNEGHTIRVSVHIVNEIKKLIKLDEEYGYLRKKERIEKIAEEMKVPIETILRLYKIHEMFYLTSYDEPIGEDGEMSLGEQYSTKIIPDIADEIVNSSYRFVLDEVMKERLTEREQSILEYRFGFKGPTMTLEEIGKIYNVHRERIRQIEAKALRKLRTDKKIQELKIYLIDE